MSSQVYEERARKFEKLIKTKPELGIVLRAADNEPVPVVVDNQPDRRTSGRQTPIMFCNAAVDDEATGWYLTSESTGLKCVLVKSSQRQLLEKSGGSQVNLVVEALRVVRYSRAGTALVCEIVTGETHGVECSAV